MAVKVLELKGYKSLKCLNAFNALMLGLKMIPAYMNVGYEDFLLALDKMEAEGQRKMIREAAMFVELQPDEVSAMVAFCTDSNGVPYSAENMGNLNPAQLVEVIVEVSFAISRFSIDLVRDDEKKNSNGSLSM